MFRAIVSFIREYYNRPDGIIPLHEPQFLGNEKKYVNDAIDSTYVSSVGPYVDRFETMMKEYTGAKYAVATTNGTAALHISLILAGVRRHDLVITQPLTFVATCNAITYLGADPLFVDIDEKTLGLSYGKLADFFNEETEQLNGVCYHRESGRRVGACVPMHSFGHPVEIDKIVELCNRFSVPVIEDAAEALGSRYKGKHTGTFGLIGTYSFNGNKTITCGGGGVLVTDDQRLGRLAKHLTTQAKVSHQWEFVHDQIGYNFRLPNLNAAMACAQLEQLDHFIYEKRNLARNYAEFFASIGLTHVGEPESASSNFWLNAVLFNDIDQRDSFLKYSNDDGVMTRPSWRVMPDLPMFKDCICLNIVNSRRIADRLVNLPSSPMMAKSNTVNKLPN